MQELVLLAWHRGCMRSAYEASDMQLCDLCRGCNFSPAGHEQGQGEQD